MNIILGVFYTEFWSKLKDSTNSYEFRDFQKLPGWEKDYSEDDFVGYCIIPAAKIANTINFLLDNLFLPLTDRSVTCRELNALLKWPDLLEKVQFWLKGEKVSTDNVLKIIQSVKDNELRFDNLDIKTF